MKDRNKQVVTALLIVTIVGIGAVLIRQRFAPEEEARQAPVVERRALPPTQNAIDVGPSPMPSRTEDGYSQVVSGDRFYAPSDESGKDASDAPLTEEECKAFAGHVEALEVRADPSAAAAFKDPEAVAALGTMCKKGQLSPKFARCAMTKSATRDFKDCGGGEVARSVKEAKAVLREFKESTGE